MLSTTVRADFDELAFHKALERIWQVVGEANRYFTSQEPEAAQD